VAAKVCAQEQSGATSTACCVGILLLLLLLGVVLLTFRFICSRNCKYNHLHTTRRLNLSCSSDRCCMTGMASSYVMCPCSCTTAMMSGDCSPALQKNWLKGEMHSSLSYASCGDALPSERCR
jgi:hypothetical protein